MLTSKDDTGKIVIGVFSSFFKVKKCVKTLSKRKQYETYCLPVKKGIRVIEKLERYLCHYFGTYEEHYIEINKNGKIKKEGDKKVLFWPDGESSDCKNKSKTNK